MSGDWKYPRVTGSLRMRFLFELVQFYTVLCLSYIIFLKICISCFYLLFSRITMFKSWRFGWWRELNVQKGTFWMMKRIKRTKRHILDYVEGHFVGINKLVNFSRKSHEKLAILAILWVFTKYASRKVCGHIPLPPTAFFILFEPFAGGGIAVDCGNDDLAAFGGGLGAKGIRQELLW